jgi:hypothetical protein
MTLLCEDFEAMYKNAKTTGSNYRVCKKTRVNQGNFLCTIKFFTLKIRLAKVVVRTLFCDKTTQIFENGCYRTKLWLL